VRETIEHYRPRLKNKLVLHFRYMSETQLEPYRLLGLRVGDTSGWIGKTGKKRTPRIRCDSDSLDETAIDAYLAEARPDLILHFGDGEARGEYEWRKHGQTALLFSPFFDRKDNAFWGYEGFVCLAAALDKAMNATWRPSSPRRGEVSHARVLQSTKFKSSRASARVTGDARPIRHLTGVQIDASRVTRRSRCAFV
jgi:hypothetical protein